MEFGKPNAPLGLAFYILYFIEYITLKMMLKYFLRTMHGR
jgi:hypothetical protein